MLTIILILLITELPLIAVVLFKLFMFNGTISINYNKTTPSKTTDMSDITDIRKATILNNSVGCVVTYLNLKAYTATSQEFFNNKVILGRYILENNPSNAWYRFSGPMRNIDWLYIDSITGVLTLTPTEELLNIDSDLPIERDVTFDIVGTAPDDDSGLIGSIRLNVRLIIQ